MTPANSTSPAAGPTVVPEPAVKQPGPNKAKTKSKPKSQTEVRPSKTLPTERISFDKQLDILRAYAAATAQGTKSATLDEVAAIVGMAPTTVSMANPFFSNVGLISKTDAGSYMPAAEVVSFLRAYEWNRETASHKLAPIIRETWFSKTLLPRLSYGPLEEDSAITALAEEASAGPEYRKQLGILIEYAIAAGLVERDGTQIRLMRASTAVAATTSASPRAESSKGSDHAPEPKNRVLTAFTQSAEGAVHFNVSVRVDMAEFAGWQPERITAFFNGIAAVLAAKAKIEEDAGS
jgi:hypothetical protein